MNDKKINKNKKKYYIYKIDKNEEKNSREIRIVYYYMDTVRDSVRNNDRFDDPLMRIYFRTIRMNFDSIEGGRTIFLINFSILKYNSLIDHLISKNDTSNKRSERINYV